MTRPVGTEQAADHDATAIGMSQIPRRERRVAEHELEEMGEHEERSRK